MITNIPKKIFYVQYILLFLYISRDCSVEFHKYYFILLSRTMNYSRITLAISALVAAAALATVAFTVPQQVMAGGHHHHSNNNNGIRVNQTISQANICDQNTLCLNNGNNSADIQR